MFSNGALMSINHLEQDQRGIKQRVRSLLGFKRFTSAARFCLAHDELRNFLRPRSRWLDAG